MAVEECNGVADTEILVQHLNMKASCGLHINVVGLALKIHYSRQH